MLINDFVQLHDTSLSLSLSLSLSALNGNTIIDNLFILVPKYFILDFNFQIFHLDVSRLSEKFSHIINKMLKLFTIQGHYYNDVLFFLSLIIHRVMPPQLHKAIMLDADLKFESDIIQLYGLFENFKKENIIGIARETQPVYRHAFGEYRKLNPSTRVGDPPPTGLTGFNSGVLLLDLDKMRRSKLYNFLIDTDAVHNLTEKYLFKGFLGDQDFFTLLSLELENLFYILPCSWNRQLCQWFRHHGYSDVFDEYFTCKGRVNLYHGNCNTSFPAYSSYYYYYFFFYYFFVFLYYFFLIRWYMDIFLGNLEYKRQNSIPTLQKTTKQKKNPPKKNNKKTTTNKQKKNKTKTTTPKNTQKTNNNP